MTDATSSDGPVLKGPVTGAEPEFLADISTDRLVGAIIALAAELYIVKDRNALLEAALRQSGALTPDALEDQGEVDTQGRQAELERYVARILGELAGTRPTKGNVDPAVARYLDPFPE